MSDETKNSRFRGMRIELTVLTERVVDGCANHNIFDDHQPPSFESLRYQQVSAMASSNKSLFRSN